MPVTLCVVKKIRKMIRIIVSQLISGVKFSISKSCREGNELDHELIDIHSTATDWMVAYIIFTKEYK